MANKRITFILIIVLLFIGINISSYAEEISIDDETVQEDNESIEEILEGDEIIEQDVEEEIIDDESELEPQISENNVRRRK